MNEDRDTIAATKLTRTEFAVVRAYAQGMRPVDIANRYLLDPDDDEVLTESQAIARILSLRDRLVQFALQHDRPDIAAMFEALRGRSDVGMTRRVDALSSLEQLGQGRPHESHEVSLWFGPSLARRLTAAGIMRIADLTALANRRGRSWWRAVPRLGPKSADIIIQWLARQGGGQGERAGAWVRPYVTTPLAAVASRPLRPLPLAPGMAYPVPLEWMASAVDQGTERGTERDADRRHVIDRSRRPDRTDLPDPLARPVSHPRAHSRHDAAPATSTLGAALERDLAWVRQWLAEGRRAAHTFKSYRREAERLLLWVAREHLTLATLTPDALARYLAFLAAPEPAGFWCGPASPRDREHWRPFEGGLGASSREAAWRVIRALLRAAHRDGHVGAPVDLPRQFDAARADTARTPGRADPPVAPAAATTAADLSGADTPSVGAADPAYPSPTDSAACIGGADIDAFLAWLEDEVNADAEGGVPDDRKRVAFIAAHLVRQGMTLGELAELRCGALPDAVMPPSALAALDRHLTNRGIDRGTIPAAALLGPLTVPPTGRAAARHRDGMRNGYSASGLDQLLRTVWREYVRVRGLSLPPFTPKMLRRRTADSGRDVGRGDVDGTLAGMPVALTATPSQAV